MLKHRQRIFIFQFVIFLIFLLIWTQLFNVQICKSAGLISKAKNQLANDQIILRGDILDRNGNLLALDLITYDLYNNVKNVDKIKPEEILNLASFLKTDSTSLKNKLSQKINTKIYSGLNESQTNIIRKDFSKLTYPKPKVTRVYPHKKMAGHILGFVNTDHKGQLGIEYFHENLITKLTESNKRSQIFPKGTSIVLTIDSALQEYAEEELNKAVAKSKATRGTIVILSPKTGEIYAWAVNPGFDPNSFYKEKIFKNWSITDIYEPGSTFKIITVSSALENMTIAETASFYDPGSIVVDKRLIKNHHHNKPKQINLLELFKQSSNVASAQIGLSMKPETFYNTIKNLMIAKRTNIDLPGESEGLLLDYKKWKKLDLATTAFGQGAVSVTPLQLACTISAIANHGEWVQPHLLKGIWEPTYKLINQSPYNISKEQVLSVEIADLVSGLLKQSVQENVKAMSYIGGQVPGYEVAGKTGTAQKIRTDGKGYFAGHTIASFIGYLPASNPELLALVVIDDPKTEGGWGNTICGPVFNNVAKLAAKRIIEGS